MIATRVEPPSVLLDTMTESSATAAGVLASWHFGILFSAEVLL